MRPTPVSGHRPDPRQQSAAIPRVERRRNRDRAERRGSAADRRGRPGRSRRRGPLPGHVERQPVARRRPALAERATAIYKPCMARAIWSGAISFGLVNVPIKLYSATSPKAVRFHQVSAKTGARIRQKRVDPSTGEEVPYEEIVKGYEITPEHYVLIAPEELEALDPKATKTIDIEEFVDLAEIDPIFYD